MENHKLGIMEMRFAELMWNHAPLSTKELVALCKEEFMWSRSTTYTMLRRLCQRGIFENADGTVIVLQTKDDFQGLQSEMFVEETFSGSFPQFIAAFVKRKKLTAVEIAELQNIINTQREENGNE